MWIDGYLSATSGDLVTNNDSIQVTSENIKQICNSNCSLKLGDILTD